MAKSYDWPGLQQVLKLQCTVKQGDQVTHEVRYAITSLKPERASAAQLLKMWRGHWAIENNLHWVRDTVFGEDKCRVRSGAAPHNLAIFRNVAINLLRLAKAPSIAPKLRHFARHSRNLLRFLGIVKN